MAQLDLIIPALNEADNLSALFARIHQTLTSAKISYRVIFVDDRSTDSTALQIKSLSTQYPITYHLKTGKPGKAYAILEGAKISSAPYIGMIDADLEYPPEALPEMFALLKKHGLVVANRLTTHSSRFRGLLSKGHRLFFGRFLLGFDCDVQSGLKLFRREIIQALDPTLVKAWAIDIPLLHTAVELGFTVGSTDIAFTSRIAGTSKCRQEIFKAVREIGLGAVRVKFSPRQVRRLAPTKSGSMLGAGVIYHRHRFITHTTLPREHSAITTFYGWQKIFLLIFFGLTIFLLFAFPHSVAVIIIAGLSLVYLGDMIFTLFLISRSLDRPPELSFSRPEIESLSSRKLPLYTILCPLYHEAEVLPQFVESIKAIDWPKDKLEVLLLLEADDKLTQAAADKLVLPSYIHRVIVPHSQPKTKPKACNYGLNFARGQYLVIYDAEDRPDPLQLKKAYLGFSSLSKDVVCLQAKLNYFNSNQNLLTRLFTAEYSLWFDVVLPGYQSINTAIPLGGTSNHFRTWALKQLHGWDAFNVTEDCDLGARLFKQGFRTALIDSTTLEEANSDLSNWIRQRSRWIKGYIQTYLVHNRRPLHFIRTHGIHAFIFQLVIGGKTIFALINPILWCLTLAYFTLYRFIGPTIESLYPAPVFYIAAFSAVFGNFLFLYYYMIGLAKRNRWDLIKYVYFVPVYWVMVSLAAFKAIFQLVLKPHFWEKTHHGLVTHPAVKKIYLHLPRFSWTISLSPKDLLIAFWLVIETFLIANVYHHPRLSITVILLSSLLYLLTSRILKNNLGRDSSPDKLRILIFNWRDIRHKWAGGAEVYLHELAKRWVGLGYEVVVFCGNDGSSPGEEVIDRVKIIRRGNFYTVYLWAIIYYLLKLRGQYNVVVDSENGIPFFTPLFSRAQKFLLIHHIHQDLFRSKLYFPLDQIALVLEAKLMPLIYRHQQIITVSESSKSDILKLGPFRPQDINIINPGIESGKFSPGPKTPYPSFVYLGRIRPQKNIDIAIKAFAQVHSMSPKSTFDIAGWGENIWQLKLLVEELHLTSSVHFHQRISETKKVSLLAKSWVMLQPSSFEGWGITVIEANASGTPVIASNVAGLRDSVIDGLSGILIPPRDPRALANSMLSLIRNKTQRERLSQNALALAANFSWDDKARDFIQVINKFSPAVGREKFILQPASANDNLDIN